MSKITAMYIRLSMEDEDVSLNQKEESNSVSSQRELLEAFIGNHSELKDTKVQEYCDDGFTGTKFERPGLRCRLALGRFAAPNANGKSSQRW